MTKLLMIDSIGEIAYPFKNSITTKICYTTPHQIHTKPFAYICDPGIPTAQTDLEKFGSSGLIESERLISLSQQQSLQRCLVVADKHDRDYLETSRQSSASAHNAERCLHNYICDSTLAASCRSESLSYKIN